MITKKSCIFSSRHPLSHQVEHSFVICSLSPVMDPFQELPAELISLVIQNTADFVTVDNLLSVSRQARAVFQVNSRAVIQDLILSNSITSQPEIKKLVTGIAIIHHPSIRCTSFDEYMQLASGEGTLEHALSLGQRNSDLACRILRTAVQIQRLACNCLSTLRQRDLAYSSTKGKRAFLLYRRVPRVLGTMAPSMSF